MHDQDADGEHALVVTVGLLLLIGTALLISCWTGPVAAFVIIAAPVLGAYALPCLFRARAGSRAPTARAGSTTRTGWSSISTRPVTTSRRYGRPPAGCASCWTSWGCPPRR